MAAPPATALVARLVEEIEETARALHVHPNTLRHRLRRFEEATRTSLRDPRVLAELWWVLERRDLR